MHLVMKAENASTGLITITLMCTVSLAGVAVIPRTTIATLVVFIVSVLFRMKFLIWFERSMINLLIKSMGLEKRPYTLQVSLL